MCACGIGDNETRTREKTEEIMTRRALNASGPACTIRAAKKDDLLPVLRLMSRADEGLKPFVEDASEHERSTWDTMLRTPNLTIYIAELHDTVVGTASFLLMPNLGYNCRPSGFIEAMVVSADVRRQGVAKKIVAQVLDDAASAGARKIQLLTHKRHATDGAHNFYRSVGFEAEAEGFRLYLQS